MITAFMAAALTVALRPRPTPTPIAVPSPAVRASASPVPLPSAPVLPSSQTQRIDAIVTKEMGMQVIPGLSLAVVRDGKVVYSRGYGFASAELQQQTRDTTLYELGSITKQFTAATILLLADDGRLTLDDPLSRYVPDFPRAKDITVRELLSMTSGIPDYTDATNIDQLAQKSATPEDLIALVKSQPLDFEPGTQWEYSNTNYVLLGTIIEKVTGSSYASALYDRIFRPLSMSSTLYGNVGASSPNLATGYIFDGARVKPDKPWNLDWGYAAGGVVSNVLDLAIWDSALLQGKSLSMASLRSMWSPVSLKDGTKVPYGLGWSVETLNGHREIEDNGGLPGYNGRNATFPNDRFDVVVLANTKSFDAGPIVRQIFELFYPPTAAQLADQRRGDDVALGRARDVYRRLSQGTLNSAMLTPNAAKRLTSKLLSDAKASLGRLGAPQKFDQVDKYLMGTQTVYVYRLAFKQGTLGFTVAFDPAGRVGQLAVQPL